MVHGGRKISEVREGGYILSDSRCEDTHFDQIPIKGFSDERKVLFLPLKISISLASLACPLFTSIVLYMNILAEDFKLSEIPLIYY